MHRPAKTSCFLFLLLSLAVLGPAGAQTARLLADIHPGPPAPGERPAPKIFMPLPGGSAFFLPGATPEAASILWATDGTDAGTRSLGSFQSPSSVGTLPGLAFFLAGSPDETGGSYHLWRTDGTEAGTFPMSPALESFPLESAVVGGRLLVNFCLVSTSDCSLYASDGSPAGTVRLAGVPAFDFTVARGIVYFLAFIPEIGVSSLWRTDGTPEGTRRVRLLRRGARLLSAAGQRLFFLVGEENAELWTSDGTSRGTTLVRTFSESGHDFLPRITNYLKATRSGGVFFVATRGGRFIGDLWHSDGTPRGTVRLTSFQETSGVKDLRQDQIAALGKNTLFVSDDGVSGSRLWSTRGSLATTAPLVGCPGDCPELLAGTPLVPMGNRVLFATRDADRGADLWTSDGTAAGTHLLATPCPGGCDAGPTQFTALAGRIWFRVTFGGTDHLARTDGTAAGTVVLAPIPTAVNLDLATDAAGGHRVFFAGTDPQDGAQPWVTDGTPAGTARVSVLPAPAASSEPANLTALGDRLLFTAWDGTQSALWVADASGSGAMIVPGTAVAGKASPANVTAVGGRAFFTFSQGDGSAQLWRTDGTAAGTAVVADFPDRSLSDLHDFGGRLLFLATPTGDAERHTPSVWASDGTVAGTVQIFSLPDDTLAVVGLTLLGGEIYMEVDRESEEEIYRSDGTAAGTRSIRKFGCCSGYPTPRFVRQGDTVYFTALDSFYRTDGTAAGTSKVFAEDADGNPPVYSPSFPFVLGGRLFVFAGTPDQGDRLVLFRVDGGQPALLAPAGSANPFDFDPQVTPLGGAVFFRAADPDHGTELWRTDGTPQGTVLVADLVPGPGSSDPQGLTAAGGRLYFSAWDEFHGRELWTSDGTAASTRLVDDVAPGAFSSAPMLMTPLGGLLFFTADDGFTGREPWVLPLTPPNV